MITVQNDEVIYRRYELLVGQAMAFSSTRQSGGWASEFSSEHKCSVGEAYQLYEIRQDLRDTVADAGRMVVYRPGMLMPLLDLLMRVAPATSCLTYCGRIAEASATAGLATLSHLAQAPMSTELRLSETSHRWCSVTHDLERLCAKSTRGATTTARNMKLHTYGAWVDFRPLGRGEQGYLMSTAVFSRITSLTRQRMMLHLGCDVGVVAVDGERLRARAEESTRWQERVLAHYGNAGYDIAKGVEAMNKIRMLEITGGSFEGVLDAMEDIREKYAKKEDKAAAAAGVENSAMTAEYIDWMRTDDDPVVCFEVFGLMKMVGSPSIDTRASGAAQIRSIRNRPPIDDEAVKKTRAAFVIDLIAEYLDDTGSWPPFLSAPRKGTVLGELYAQRAASFFPETVPLADATGVRFGKLLSLPLPDTILEQADDKTVALPIPETREYWEGGERQKRRLVPWISAQPELLEPREIVEMMKTRSFDRDEHVVAECLKGGEMKGGADYVGRAFSVDRPYIRAGLNIIESAVAAVMDRWDKATTMTEGRTKTSQRFQRMSRLGAGRVVFCEFDLGEWNKRFCEANTYLIVADFDDIFDEPGLFSFPHYHFKRSLTYLRSPGDPPTFDAQGVPVASEGMVWGGEDKIEGIEHDAGHEGKFQKGWTEHTKAMARAATWDLGVEIDWVVQGDNLVAALRPAARDPRTDEEITILVQTRLKDFFASVGHDLKPEECIVGKTGLSYSKDAWYLGVTYSSILKVLTRIKPTSAGVPTTWITAIESVAAGVIAAGTKTCRHDRLFVLAKLLEQEALESVAASGGYMPLKTTTERLLASTLASSMGGCANVTLASIMFKGCTDPLSSDLAVLVNATRLPNLAGDSRALASKILQAFEHEVVWRKRPHLGSLVQDPSSIPLVAPVSAKTVIGEQVLAYVAGTTLNPMIREICVEEEDSVTSVLVETRPLYPALIREVLDSSPAGMLKRYAARIYKTSTLRDMAYDDNPGGIDAAYSEEASSRYQFVQLVARLVEGCKTVMTSRRSAYAHCVQYRERWGVAASDFAGITTVSPLSSTPVSSRLHGAIGCMLMLTPGVSATTTRGNNMPYLGVATREQREGDEWVATADVGKVARLQRLARMSVHLGEDAVVTRLLDAVVRAASDTSLEDVKRHTPLPTGGTVAHRLDVLDRQPFHLAANPTTATHCYISANHADLADDPPIAVQEYYLMSLALATLVAHKSDLRRSRGFFYIPDLVGVPNVVSEMPRYVGPADPVFTLKPQVFGRVTGIEYRSKRGDAPVQWNAAAPAEVGAKVILRTIYMSLLATSASISANLGKTGSVGGGHVNGPFDHTEFASFGFADHISVASQAIATYATYRYALTYHVRNEDREPLHVLTTRLCGSVALAVAGYCEIQADAILDYVASEGLVIGGGTSGSSRRRATLTTRLIEATERRLAAKRYWCGRILVPSDSSSDAVFTRMWAVCSAVEWNGHMRPGSLAGLVHVIRGSEGTGGAGRPSDIVASLSYYDMSPDALVRKQLALASAMVEPPLLWTPSTLLSLQRTLRGRRQIAPPARLMRFVDGDCVWKVLEEEHELILDLPELIASMSDVERDGLTKERGGGAGITSELTGTFASLAQCLPRGGEAMVVGSGGGSFAAALVAELDVGVDEVDMLDIRPWSDQEGASAVSEEVLSVLGRRSRKVRPHAFYVIGRDILDVENHDDAGLERYSILVVDVQMYPARPSLRRIAVLLGQYMRKRTDGAWMWRVLLRASEIDGVATTLRETTGTIVHCTLISVAQMVDAVFAGGNISPKTADIPSLTPATLDDKEAVVKRMAQRYLRTVQAQNVAKTVRSMADWQRLLDRFEEWKSKQRIGGWIRRSAEYDTMVLLAAVLGYGRMDPMTTEWIAAAAAGDDVGVPEGISAAGVRAPGEIRILSRTGYRLGMAIRLAAA